MRPPLDDVASEALLQLTEAWERRRLPAFDLASAMFVHGAAGVLYDLGEDAFEEALRVTIAQLKAALPPRGTSH